MKLEGLSEFQSDLLAVATKDKPRESLQIMRKLGSKARTIVARRARRDVNKRSGMYAKRFKRGKAFKDGDEYVVRVYNSSPHAHIIENGHRQVLPNGQEVGFVPGKKVIEKGMREFEQSGQVDDMVSDWLDDLLTKRGL